VLWNVPSLPPQVHRLFSNPESLHAAFWRTPAPTSIGIGASSSSGSNRGEVHSPEGAPNGPMHNMSAMDNPGPGQGATSTAGSQPDRGLCASTSQRPAPLGPASEGLTGGQAGGPDTRLQGASPGSAAQCGDNVGCDGSGQSGSGSGGSGSCRRSSSSGGGVGHGLGGQVGQVHESKAANGLERQMASTCLGVAGMGDGSRDRGKRVNAGYKDSLSGGGEGIRSADDAGGGEGWLRLQGPYEQVRSMWLPACSMLGLCWRCGCGCALLTRWPGCIRGRAAHHPARWQG